MAAAETSAATGSSRRRPGSRDMMDGGSPHRSRRERFTALPYMLLAPALVVFGAVLGYPLYILIKLSFQKYGNLQFVSGAPAKWIGLDNYSQLFGNEVVNGESTFLDTLLRTVVFTFLCVVLTLAIGMLVALLLRRLKAWLRQGIMVGLILAWVMPAITATLVWGWMFETQYGIVNYVGNALGVHWFDGRDWFGRSAVLAFIVIIMMIVWQAVPFVALALHAGLTQIPNEIYEAASVDGAGPVKTFRRITWPSLRPIMMLLVILSTIWDSSVFTQIWVMTHGGPNNGTTTLGVWAYTTAFSHHSYGLGAAVAVISVLLVGVVVIYYIRRMFRSGEAA